MDYTLKAAANPAHKEGPGSSILTGQVPLFHSIGRCGRSFPILSDICLLPQTHYAQIPR